MENDNKDKQSRLEKLKSFLKGLKGKKPDYNNLDFSKWNQTEEEYQEDQRKWVEELKGHRKKGKGTKPFS